MTWAGIKAMALFDQNESVIYGATQRGFEEDHVLGLFCETRGNAKSVGISDFANITPSLIITLKSPTSMFSLKQVGHN